MSLPDICPRCGHADFYQHECKRDDMKRDLSDEARAVGNWRRSKGFFTPDARHFQEEVPATLTNADAMLGKLMLIVCEVAEAAEDCRTGEYAKFKIEIADAAIRILDICDASGIDLRQSLEEKMVLNWQRPVRHGKITVL